MKKFTIFVVAAALVLSLSACGRRKEDPVQDTTTVPSTATPTETMPTTGTNVPDPTVNDNSTENQNGTDQVLPDSENDTKAATDSAKSR